MGLMAVFLCRQFGAARIYSTEAADVDRRFALATEFGASLTFDVSKGSSGLHKSVAKHEIGQNGVDVVMEMSGSPFRLFRRIQGQKWWHRSSSGDHAQAA